MPKVKAAEAQLAGQLRDQLSLRAVFEEVRAEWNERYGAIVADLIHVQVFLIEIAGVEELQLEGKIVAVPVGLLMPEPEIAVLVVAELVQEIWHLARLGVVRLGSFLPRQVGEPVQSHGRGLRLGR